MKPTICIGGFDDERLKKTRDAGFKYVEISFGEVALKTEAELKEYLSKLDELGLVPVAGNGFFPWTLKPENGFFQPEFDIGAVKEYIEMAFEKTACIKWNSIAFGSGRFRVMPEGYDIKKAEDLFCSVISDIVVPKLEKYDAVLSIEELNSGETNFLNSCTQVMDIAKRVNHPKVGILCDYYHMSLAGETAADVPDFAKYITHIHIASPSNNRTVPFAYDSDKDNYDAFFASLKACGYKHEYLSVEGHLPGDVDEQKALNDCYEFLNSKTGAF